MITLPSQIREFLLAVLSPYSYDLKRNVYIWFGVFWGLPIPLVTMLYEYRILASSGSCKPFELLTSPMQWLFLLHPVLFGVIFGILGTVRQEKELKLVDTIGQLRYLTTHDQLTGLKNRRYLAHNFHDECARSQRRSEHLSLLFVDIDHFKRINDEHGHHLGDMVLRELGRYLRIQCRPYDTPIRWGGEEFAILLPNAGPGEAASIAERIRAAIAAQRCTAGQHRITVTASIGISYCQPHERPSQVLERADRALYLAKHSGRNRCCQISPADNVSHGAEPALQSAAGTSAAGGH